ncbi:MAG: DMT family transporter [Actinobacteria bacterium]|nr:DMT family transporter [Actinomycetota bacterium]
MADLPSLRAHRSGVLALAVAGFLFGSTFLIVERAIERAEVLPFLAARFLIASLVLLPLALRRPPTPGVAAHGFLAGLCLLAGYVLQTVGLRDTTPAASAFITYLLVVIVPVIVAVRTRRWPTANVVLGVALAVAGLYALAGGTGGLGRGELLTLGCAVAFAVHLLVVGAVAERHDPFRFTFWQVLTVGTLCLVPGAFAGSGPTAGYGFDEGVWVAAAVCGIGATAIAFWCMVWGQRVVPETQAAIILLLEPVSAGVLGELTGDSLGWRGALGAGLILAAVVVSEVLGRPPGVVGAELVVVPDHDGVDDPGYVFDPDGGVGG